MMLDEQLRSVPLRDVLQVVRDFRPRRELTMVFSVQEYGSHMENTGTATVATRILAASQARQRRPDYTREVTALLEAARKVIAETGKARVADIVAEAGLSNDAFYRYFESKDALIAALIEEGTERLAALAAHQMAAEADPEAKVRVWLEMMVGQADPKRAEKTVALIGLSANSNTGLATGQPVRDPLARLLEEPLAELGSADPRFDSVLVTHAVMSVVSSQMWTGSKLQKGDRDYLLRFCLGVPRMMEGPA
jgi:AcrR family transcriptional regulator